MKNIFRVRNLIEKAIKEHDLDLTGLTVFTETGSNNFVVTPIIAAMAGAKVYAITRDSKYGDKWDIKHSTESFAEFCHVKGRIEVIFEIDKDKVWESNIITNLGFVRPIDKKLIDMMNPKAVIPFMCEAWEYRPGDFDFDYCKKKGIVVMATYEGDIFDYCGPLCAKMLFDEEIEILNSKIAIISGDKYGETIKWYLEKMGAGVEIIDSILSLDLSYDALVVARHKAGHWCLPPPYLDKISLIVFADNLKMTKTLGDLSPKAVIDLHCAGLKVGEEMARARLKGHTVGDTKSFTIMNSLSERME